LKRGRRSARIGVLLLPRPVIAGWGALSEEIRRALLARLRARYRCPACHASLCAPESPEGIGCPACGVLYPSLPGGTPLLLVPSARSHFERLLARDPGGSRMAEEYRRYGSRRARLRSWLRPPSIVLDRDAARRNSWIYDTRGPETLVLSIGGGPGRENPRVINLNIDAFEAVDIVGDGTNIPLDDESVDTVTCNAVIEHVSEPVRLVGEMRRVLRPGGYAQLMIPFVFPYHAYPADFQRFTLSGVEHLMRSFEKVELSVLTGPTSAMLVLLREYLRLLVPGGNTGAGRFLLNGISGWLTFPLKYLDVLLNRRPEAVHLAAAFYYLGRRPAREP